MDNKTILTNAILELVKKNGCSNDILTKLSCGKIDICTALIHIIKTVKIPEDDLWGFCCYVDDWDVYKAVADKINFNAKSESELLKIGYEINRIPIWEAIVRTNKLSRPKLLGVGHAVAGRIERFIVWMLIVATKKINASLFLVEMGYRNHPNFNTLVYMMENE